MERLGKNTNALNWFEIPATDLDRAKAFYEKIFEIEMQVIDMMGIKMAMFPCEPPHSSGGLVQGPDHKPSKEGAVIYLNGNPDLQQVLDRLEAEGAEITLPKTSIGENGFMAFFVDSEGNLVGLHSGG
ncbi:VOC family protein [Algoriphagus jejuensis]|uniref:VOC family protein n=1 Tax=Algoriphagus jejuensis TaxID=419934 RepID=A0ABN1N5T3_9BACT